jgi:pyruvate kinase
MSSKSFAPSIRSVWSISSQSLSNEDHQGLFSTLKNAHLTGLYVPYFYDKELGSKPLKHLKTYLKDHNAKSKASLTPFLFSLKGKRFFLVVPPSEAKAFQKGENLELTITYDKEFCFDSHTFFGKNKSLPSQGLTLFVSSPCLLKSFEEGVRFALTSQNSSLILQAIECGPSGSLVATTCEDGHVEEGVHDVILEVSNGLFPLTEVDEQTLLSKDFKEMCDFLILKDVKVRDEIYKIRDLILGKKEKYSLKHPNLPLNEELHLREGSINPKIILSIDSKEMVECLDDVIYEIDGVLLNRRKLAQSLPIEQIPLLQKKILELCRHQAKISLISSDYLNSMEYNPNPTRAEVTDIANSVFDGGHALVIARNVSEGKFANDAALVLHEILENSSRGVTVSKGVSQPKNYLPLEEDIIALGAVTMAHAEHAKAIVCYTQGGYTPLKISSYLHKLHIPIIALTPNYKLASQLELIRDTSPFVIHEHKDFSDILEKTKKIVEEDFHLKKGDKFVFVSLSTALLSKNPSHFFTLQNI